MINYDRLPLFPLHVVLYPDMPLPLHIFEPRYREMVLRCREENSPFGVVLLQNGMEAGIEPQPYSVGTTARITQYEELEDGRLNIVVLGETRFRIQETYSDHAYLTGRVLPFWEEAAASANLKSAFDQSIGLFKTYLRTLLALTNRPLSALQFPHDPEYLSYAIASVAQISLLEKQRLLEMTSTEKRIEREIEILTREIEAQTSLRELQQDAHAGVGSVILPVDTQELSKLSSLN